MTSVIALSDRRFVPHIAGELNEWWSLVKDRARSTVTTRSGVRIYCMQSFDDLAALLVDAEPAKFIALEIVSSRTIARDPAVLQSDLFVNEPPVKRLYATDLFATVAPVIDAAEDRA